QVVPSVTARAPVTHTTKYRTATHDADAFLRDLEDLFAIDDPVTQPASLPAAS
ncbi:hypothetical protein SARC_17836, partial [Sphaeroforma arctica JP610]